MEKPEDSAATAAAAENCASHPAAPGFSRGAPPARGAGGTDRATPAGGAPPVEHAPGLVGAATEAWIAFRQQRHFGSLDGLRCASILAVLWHHSPHGDLTPATRGFLGVDLFFVLSGFLITTLLLRERAATGTISLRAFYMRRLLRIFPLYYATLFGCVVLALLRPGSAVSQDFLRVLPWYLTYTSNWGPTEDFFAHAWSLAVEEQFYLVWPPILVFAGTRRAVPALAVFLTGNVALDLGLFGPEALEIGRRLAAFTAIGFGVLLGIAMHQPRTFAWLEPFVGRHWSILLPLGALAALVWVPGDIAGWPRLAIHLAMTWLVAAAVARTNHGLASALRQRLVVHIGAISYGMYLLHGLCLIATHALLGRRDPGVVVPFFVVGTLLTVVVATASHRYFERPFLRLKTRFERRR